MNVVKLKLVLFSATSTSWFTRALEEENLSPGILSSRFIWNYFSAFLVNNFSGISLLPYKNSGGRKIVAYISGARRVLSIAATPFFNEIPSAALNLTQTQRVKIIRRTTSTGAAAVGDAHRMVTIRNEILRLKCFLTWHWPPGLLFLHCAVVTQLLPIKAEMSIKMITLWEHRPRRLHFICVRHACETAGGRTHHLITRRLQIFIWNRRTTQ